MRNQRGVTLVGMLVAGIVIVLVAIGGLKIAPAYIEYFKVKKAVSAIAVTNAGGTVADVRRSFDLRAAVDDIDVIAGRDLEVTKDGNELVVSFAYPKRISLFGNINVVIDFAGSSSNN
jgi:Tfp pilus assembly major pilin PilA